MSVLVRQDCFRRVMMRCWNSVIAGGVVLLVNMPVWCGATEPPHLKTERFEVTSAALGEAIYYAKTNEKLAAATQLMIADARGNDEAQIVPRHLFLSSLLWQLGATDAAARILEATPVPENSPYFRQRVRLQQAEIALRRGDLVAFERAVAILQQQAGEKEIHKDIAQALKTLQLQALLLSGNVNQAKQHFETLPVDHPARPFLYQTILTHLMQNADVPSPQKTATKNVASEVSATEVQVPLMSWEQWIMDIPLIAEEKREVEEKQHATRKALSSFDALHYKRALRERHALQRAYVSLERSDFVSALSTFDQIPDDSPFLAEALLGKTRAHVGLGRASHARATWQIMRKQVPDDVQTVQAGVWVALALEHEGAFQEAFEVLDAQAKRLRYFRDIFQAFEKVSIPLSAEHALLETDPIARLYFEDLNLDSAWLYAIVRWEHLIEAKKVLAANAKRLVALQEGFALKQHLRQTRASDASLATYDQRRVFLDQEHQAVVKAFFDRVARYGDLALAKPATQELWTTVQTAKRRLNRIQRQQAAQPELEFTDGNTAQTVLDASQGVLLWQAYEDALDRGWRVTWLSEQHQAGLLEAQDRLQRIERWILHQQDLVRDAQRLAVFSEQWQRLSHGVSGAIQHESDYVVQKQQQFYGQLLHQVDDLDQRIRYGLARVEDALWRQQHSDQPRRRLETMPLSQGPKSSSSSSSDVSKPDVVPGPDDREGTP